MNINSCTQWARRLATYTWVNRGSEKEFCRICAGDQRIGFVAPGSRWRASLKKNGSSTKKPDRTQIIPPSRSQTTLDLYSDEDLDEMIAAQEKFLDAVGFESGSVQ